jgi:hypothetical protein
LGEPRGVALPGARGHAGGRAGTMLPGGRGRAPCQGAGEGRRRALGAGGGALSRARGRGRGSRRTPGEPRAGAAHARGRGEGSRAGEKKGRGRERGRGRGELTSGSKFGDHRLQNLGHHKERVRWRRGGCCAGKSNERKGEKGGDAHIGEGQGTGGTRARAGRLGWAGSRAGTEAPNTRNHRSESKSRNETKQNTRLSTTSDKEI